VSRVCRRALLVGVFIPCVFIPCVFIPCEMDIYDVDFYRCPSGLSQQAARWHSSLGNSTSADQYHMNLSVTLGGVSCQDDSDGVAAPCVPFQLEEPSSPLPTDQSSSAPSSPTSPAMPPPPEMKSLLRMMTKDRWNMHPCSQFATGLVSNESTVLSKVATEGIKLLEDSMQNQQNGLLFSEAEDGCGGVYIVRGADGSCVSVFKPVDEEVRVHHRSLEKCISEPCLSEEMRYITATGAAREVFAFYLDRIDGGFSGVPVTVMCTVTNQLGQKKWGSLQSYVNHDDSAENFGSSMMVSDEVHKVGVLDIRLVNCDRHFANILCRKDGKGLALTPIDHGNILPSCFHLNEARFEWLHWKQARDPFCNKTLQHIASLNPERDANLLRALDLEEESVISMVLATKILQVGAAASLSLWDIGNIIQRNTCNPEHESVLERSIHTVLGRCTTKEAILHHSGLIANNAVSQALKGNHLRTTSITMA
jgi:hypothetical protein